MFDWIVLIGIAVGLSMDATAVAVSYGVSHSALKRKQALFIALVFGVFQGIMPLIGYFIAKFATDA
ncbi:MAG: manganese efflux pump, partial [Christensenellaceae bacterium]|nr:manganese efflux pump [Christensenellaceae bacterium]